MVRTGIRFEPPAISVPAEVDWVLARAFGPVDESLESPIGLDVHRAVGLADRLALMGRIAARTFEEVLTAEVGAEHYRRFELTLHRNVAVELRHEQVCRELVGVAADLEAPLVLLKGMALQLLGATTPGARQTADIDVVLPSELCVAFHDELLTRGFKASGVAAPEHHLSMLLHRSGAAVEVHVEIEGVRFEPDRYARGEDCLSRGQVQTAPGWSQGCWLPSDPLLLAHLLAHGLSHHGEAPEVYPAFQMVMDLQDLLERSGEKLDCLAEPVHRWIEEEVSAEEARAAIDLARRLADGETGSVLAAETSPTGTLLCHFLAGALDPAYRRSLKLRRRLAGRRGRGRWRQIAQNFEDALWLSDLQVEILYGKPKARVGYLGWRLWRPIDLVGRTLRAAGAWFDVRSRRRD